MSLFFPEYAEEFRALLDAARGRKIAVAGHMRPDGDCISSQFAAADFLRQAGAAQVVCVNQNKVPYLYENFAVGETMLDAETFDDASFDIMTVDCADYARTNLSLCKRFPEPLACIDHHATNRPSAKINIIDAKAGATAELIGGLALDAGLEISKETANRLYMGIVMDTRQFTTTSTRTKTFEIATSLVKAGADAAWVAIQLYQREKFAKLKLLASYLQTLTMHFDGRVCIGLLPEGVYEKTGAEKADSDGLVDYARSVDGVDIAVLLEDMKNGVKGSLRAKTPKYKVNEIAAHFGGGGHLAAAGFTAEGETINTFYPKLLNLIEASLQNADRLK
ncbi:MAG: DHH family phosphoesterase [Candidatus Merdousia sp.]|nr:DHH family phosphoesterase [Candidatus Merdousia sp.]